VFGGDCCLFKSLLDDVLLVLDASSLSHMRVLSVDFDVDEARYEEDVQLLTKDWKS
ncbi:hypothetical protein A2U01_0062091, partial [Trifolium medium]|nr:hypothetical protein [Trifolium medium]